MQSTCQGLLTARLRATVLGPSDLNVIPRVTRAIDGAEPKRPEKRQEKVRVSEVVRLYPATGPPLRSLQLIPKRPTERLGIFHESAETKVCGVSAVILRQVTKDSR